MTRNSRVQATALAYVCSFKTPAWISGAAAVLRAFTLLLALGLPGARLGAADDSVWGRPVVKVRLNADADLTAAQFKTEIIQKEQEPLDRSKVAASLKNLYATGRFVELVAVAEPQGQSVTLVFQAKARYYIGVVRVQGAPRNVDAAALESASRLRLGQPLSPEALTEAKSRIISVLQSNAYYTAKVEAEEDRHRESEEADILFTVTPGPAARLSGVDFTGDPGVPPGTLLKKAGWKAGMQLRSTRLERGLSRLRAFYVKRDHLEAAASAEKRAYDPKTGTERLTVRVDRGPQIRIRVAGARVSASTLRSVLPAYRQASADQLTLVEGEQALQNYFGQKGHYLAQVKLAAKTPSGSQGNLDVTYAVNRGPKGRFVGYAFRGNQLVARSDLADVVALQPAGSVFSRRGRFDSDLLDRSVQAISTLYQGRGFLEAKVSTSLDENYQGQSHALFVTFNIEEGSQVHVGKLTLTGLGESDQKRIGSAMLTQPGKPYSPARARADRDAILTDLTNHGYSQATASWNASEPTAQHLVDVEYQVNTGPRQTIRRVVVLGNEFTRDTVIDRQINIEGGQALNHSALLTTQQRLYDLGLFNQVQVSTQDPGSPQDEKTVLVGVEEAKRWTLGYGGGLDVQRLPGNSVSSSSESSTTPAATPPSPTQYGVSPRVSFEVDRINLGGRPQTYTLAGHYSNLEKVGSTSYSIPNFLGHPSLDLRITGLVDQSRNVLTFNSKREEASVSLQKRYSPHSSLVGRYNFRHVSVSNLQINPAVVPLLSQSVLVATVGGSYINDRRDNPVDATRGSYSSVDADLAWTGFGSSADFGRISFQNSTYYRLSPHLVLARNTRLGVEPTFGPPLALTPGTPPPTGVNQILEGVPLPERFFMGGADTHRAFSLNEAGPRDLITGFPLGGRALFLNQVELRFPLAQNRLGLVLFEDAGNTFSTIDRMKLLKFTQNSPTEFDYDVQAAGLGVRYQTPVGPLRFDVAYSPNIPRYVVCANTSLAVCPASEVEVLRLPSFQFFLSVGQSF
ncbi:MAG TPA: POTRA domain-containing protein [Terriglobia bacterium]